MVFAKGRGPGLYFFLLILAIIRNKLQSGAGHDTLTLDGAMRKGYFGYGMIWYD